MYAALRATSRTLVHFLGHEMRSGGDDLATRFDSASGGTMSVMLETPEEMSDREQGLSVWLYRVVRDEQTLNVPHPPRSDRHVSAPLPLRLFYLLSPIVTTETDRSSELEQLILGRAMQALHDHPKFRGVDLREEFTGTQVEFHVRLEPLSLEELTRVWEALDRSYQLSVSYEVSVVNIDSARQPQVRPVVDEVDSGLGIIVTAGTE